MTVCVCTRAAGPLAGRVRVPSDKSLSHRAVLFSAMAEGTSSVHGLLDSADVRSSIAAVSALGARCELTHDADGSLSGTITGWGDQGPSQPSGEIDCGNSGTTARLLLGMLSGWPVSVTLTGDESLSSRPMLRVTRPLEAMGARFAARDGGTLPLTVSGVSPLAVTTYESPVASAQVKSALLLAALRAQGTSVVAEPHLSRDHTERLLPAYGVALEADPVACRVALTGPQSLRATTIAVPGDPSSAAFIVAAALLVPGSHVTVTDLSINPTRIGFLRVLERMGARVSVTATAHMGAEPTGSLDIVHGAPLQGVTVAADEIPALIDEIPVLALVASQAHGTTRFEDVGELRVKESDRLAAIEDGLRRLGVVVRSGVDWLEVDGPAALEGAALDSLGDHRLAMSWALAGLIARDPVEVGRFESIDVSFPGFTHVLESLGA